MTVHQGNSVTREEKADTNDEEKEREAGSVGGVLCVFFFLLKRLFSICTIQKGHNDTDNLLMSSLHATCSPKQGFNRQLLCTGKGNKRGRYSLIFKQM